MRKRAPAVARWADNEREHRRGKRASPSACTPRKWKSCRKEGSSKRRQRRLRPEPVAPRSPSKRTASVNTRGRSPDSQVIAIRLAFPFPNLGNSGFTSTGSLAAHSGATVREFHPLPFSLTQSPSSAGRAPRTFHGYHIAGARSNQRGFALKTGQSRFTGL